MNKSDAFHELRAPESSPNELSVHSQSLSAHAALLYLELHRRRIQVEVQGSQERYDEIASMALRMRSPVDWYQFECRIEYYRRDRMPNGTVQRIKVDRNSSSTRKQSRNIY